MMDFLALCFHAILRVAVVLLSIGVLADLLHKNKDAVMSGLRKLWINLRDLAGGATRLCDIAIAKARAALHAVEWWSCLSTVAAIAACSFVMLSICRDAGGGVGRDMLELTPDIDPLEVRVVRYETIKDPGGVIVPEWRLEKRILTRQFFGLGLSESREWQTQWVCDDEYEAMLDWLTWAGGISREAHIRLFRRHCRLPPEPDTRPREVIAIPDEGIVD